MNKWIIAATLLFSPLTSEEAKDQKQPPLQEEVVETHHSININGKAVPYKAKAGNILLKDEAGKTKASIFYIAYHKEDELLSERPITYCFNGGPGCASIWLHMGVFGPKRVLVENGSTTFPYQLVDNESSILDVTDLVFIDPISTGYSIPAHGEDLKQFHGFEEDVKWVAEFIRLYTSKNNRWSSPKFLAGESYGTTRAVGLADYLQDNYGLNCNGLILISSALDFQTLPNIRSNSGNDISYVISLPSLTAAAWFHQKLPETLQRKSLADVLKESENFATTKYLLALVKGDQLTDTEKKDLTAQLTKFTGLSSDYIEQSNYRVNNYRFQKELLRNQQRTIGRYDCRVKGIDQDHNLHCLEYDPSAVYIKGGFSTCLQSYLRNDLNCKREEIYHLSGKVTEWNYGDGGENKYLNVCPMLAEAIAKNQNLKVFVATGIYDLAIPFYATKYTFSHLGLDRTLQKNISQFYYNAGHMMYTDSKILSEMGQDISNFIQNSSPKREES